jgi:hypothetical protein
MQKCPSVNAASVVLLVALAALAYKLGYNVISFCALARRGMARHEPHLRYQTQPFEIFLIPVIALAAVWADITPRPWWAVALLSTAALVASYAAWFPIQAIARRRISSARHTR